MWAELWPPFNLNYILGVLRELPQNEGKKCNTLNTEYFEYLIQKIN